MPQEMLSLGGFRFAMETAAYKEFEHVASYRWASQQRIGRHPAKHFIGEDHQTISLSGTIYPEFAGGLGSIKQLQAMAGTGLAMPVITSTGQIFSKLYCVERIASTQTIFAQGGKAKKIEFTVELSSYGGN